MTGEAERVSNLPEKPEAPILPWKAMEREVRPLFIASPVLRPLLETSPLRERAFTLAGDRWQLRVWYQPNHRAIPLEARIGAPHWWECRSWKG